MYLDRDHTVCYVLLELHTIVLLVQALVYGIGNLVVFLLTINFEEQGPRPAYIIASIILGIKTESRDTLEKG